MCVLGRAFEMTVQLAMLRCEFEMQVWACNVEAQLMRCGYVLRAVACDQIRKLIHIETSLITTVLCLHPAKSHPNDLTVARRLYMLKHCTLTRRSSLLDQVERVVPRLLLAAELIPLDRYIHSVTALEEDSPHLATIRTLDLPTSPVASDARGCGRGALLASNGT